ncbi:hypothetical protein F183_A12990 [Bryobacterales bacterium F-183]|nr:hypothetical protein F183_A12990 [Bryobacterales bacterium F-183]
MNKRSALTALPLLFFCLTATGCSDKVAREYAMQLSALLDEYVKKSDHLIQTENARYTAEAKELEKARSESVLDRLDQDRRALVTKRYLDGLITGREDARGFLNDAVMQYAEKDHAATKELYLKLDTAYLEHLKTRQPLEVDRAKVATLKAALDDLAKEPDAIDFATQLIQFQGALKSSLAYEQCLDLASEIDALKKKKAPAGSPLLEAIAADLESSLKQARATGRYNEAANTCTAP